MRPEQQTENKEKGIMSNMENDLAIFLTWKIENIKKTTKFGQSKSWKLTRKEKDSETDGYQIQNHH